jgi:hypothetical protein
MAATEIVHCRKEPYDVYIGRRNNRAKLPESPYANRSGGDYESYLLGKIQNEPGFAAHLMTLRGKRLGCWCKGTSRDFSKCHGHIVAKWTELIASKWEELQPDKAAMQSWLKERK